MTAPLRPRARAPVGRLGDHDVVDLGDARRPAGLKDVPALAEVRRIFVGALGLLVLVVVVVAMTALVELVCDARTEAVDVTPVRVYPGGRV